MEVIYFIHISFIRVFNRSSHIFHSRQFICSSSTPICAPSLLTDARTALPTVSFTSSFGVSYIDFLMVEFLLFLFCKFVSQNTMIPLNVSTQPVLIAWRTSFVNWSGSKSIRASWGYELAIIYPTSPVWCRIIVDAGGRGQGKVRRQLSTPSLPLWYKFLSIPSLPLTFQWENTEYLLTKIMFALLAELPEDQIEYDIPSFTHEAGWITVKCAIWFF